MSEAKSTNENEPDPMAIIARLYVKEDGTLNRNTEVPLEALSYDSLRTIVSRLDPTNDRGADDLRSISEIVRSRLERDEHPPVDEDK